MYDSGAGLLAHRLYSQAALHAEYGGVVPELASRDHVRKVVPLLDEVLRAAGLAGPGDIDGIAYTAGPGLVGALLVGAAIGRSLASLLALTALPALSAPQAGEDDLTFFETVDVNVVNIELPTLAQPGRPTKNSSP